MNTYTEERITELFDELAREAQDNHTADILDELRQLIEADIGKKGSRSK